MDHLVGGSDAAQGMARAMSRIGQSGANRSPSVAGERTMPGLTQLTRMPCGAPSAASCRVSATMPPLLAVCATRWFVMDPVSPAVDPMRSTVPPLRALSCGQAARVTRKTMSSSLRNVNDQSAYVVASNAAKRVAPALL